MKVSAIAFPYVYEHLNIGENPTTESLRSEAVGLPLRIWWGEAALLVHLTLKETEENPEA